MAVLLVDIGNVLLDVDFYRFCSKTADLTGLSEDAVFNHFCTGPLKEEMDKGWRSPQSFLEAAAEACNVRLNYSELKEYWADIFTLKTECMSVLQQLRNRYELWIMSDTDPLHFTYFMNHYPLLRSFDYYVLSYVSGNLKSEAEAFAVFDQDPGAYTLIDDKKINCATARQCGLNSIHFQSWEQVAAALSG